MGDAPEIAGLTGLSLSKASPASGPDGETRLGSPGSSPASGPVGETRLGSPGSSPASGPDGETRLGSPGSSPARTQARRRAPPDGQQSDRICHDGAWRFQE